MRNLLVVSVMTTVCVATVDAIGGNTGRPPDDLSGQAFGSSQGARAEAAERPAGPE